MSSPHATTSLPERLRQQIGDGPERPAVITGAERLTFGDLGIAVQAVADRLGRHPPDTVALFLDPGPDLVIAAWAALTCGSTYVPLSPAYPAKRLAYMLSDSGSEVILTSRRRAAEARALSGIDPVTVIVVDDDPAPGPESRPDTCRQTHMPHQDEVAYVLYTSGSTGAPKGVEITHGALHHQIAWTSTDLGLRPGSRILQKTPVSFDAAQWELLANATGATVVTDHGDLHRRPAELLDCVRRHRVTHLQTVPTLLGELCLDPSMADCHSLEVIAAGGESFPGPTAALVRELLPAARVVNLYGPTETTINITAHTVTDADCDHRDVPLGRAVPGHRLFLLDEHGDILEPSSRHPGPVVGELAIDGPQLARGYRNRPDETAASFITRIVDDGTPHRLYRTGDLVEVADGALRFRGRSDQQVSLRGHRIELEEVRRAVEAHRAVRRAAVVATGGVVPTLAAHVELSGGQEGDEIVDLRRHLASRLPTFMVPATIVVSAGLPRLPNGKIDHAALRTGTVDEVHGRADAHCDPAEHVLSELWHRVLPGIGSRPIARTASFLDLGGNSLTALRLIDAVERACGVRWTLDTVTVHDTLSEQAALLSAPEPPSATSRLMPLAGSGGPPVVFWPGLGGSPFGLRVLARAVAAGGSTCFGVRSDGLHPGEVPPRSLRTAAVSDAALLAALPPGPVTLVGYSAGSRCAAEVAALLTETGRPPAALILVAPGSPAGILRPVPTGSDPYGDPGFVRILYSVFTGVLTGPDADLVVAQTCDRASFVTALASRLGSYPAFVERVCRIAEAGFAGDAGPAQIRAVATTLLTAAGDDDRYWPTVHGSIRHEELDADHYQIVRVPEVWRTAARIRHAITRSSDSSPH